MGRHLVLAKTPDAVAEKLNAAIGKILKEEAVQHRLEPFGVQLIHTPLKGTSEFFNAEVKRWGDMVRALNLSVN